MSTAFPRDTSSPDGAAGRPLKSPVFTLTKRFETRLARLLRSDFGPPDGPETSDQRMGLPNLWFCIVLIAESWAITISKRQVRHPHGRGRVDTGLGVEEYSGMPTADR